MDVVGEDMAVVEVTEEDAEVRIKWRWKIHCGDPCREKPKEEVQICYVNLLAKDCVFHVQLWLLVIDDEELRGIHVGAVVGH